MPNALIKLVAMLLLFVQGLVAFAPGRVICIPAQPCESHAQDNHESCGHCVRVSCDEDAVAGTCDDHEHGPFSYATHSPDDCGCHIHVPVPASEQIPSVPRSESTEFRLAIVPLQITIVFAWDIEPALVVVERLRPPDFSMSDQVLALKATRLLI